MKKQTRRRQVERKIVEYLREKKPQRWIQRQLKVSVRRIVKIQEQAKAHGYLDGKLLPVYPEALFLDPIDGRTQKSSDINLLLAAKKEWIEDRLRTGWRPVTVLEELGIDVTKSSFYRFLNRHSLTKLGSHYRRVVPEIVHEPGEALQLDWGKLRNVFDERTGKNKTLWAFVGVLGFSRYSMVRLVWSNDVASTLSAIESMLSELGGVPRRVTSDNPKCFALTASDYEPILNPAFERFAGHYDFTIECLPPRDPQKKGKVERLMPYIRRLYEAHGMGWSGLEESQTYINRKLSIANERKHGTTGFKPVEQLVNVEANFLKALPATSYEIEECLDGTVRRDGHVRFGNKYYSVDEKFIGEDVLVLANQKQVSLYHKGKLIEVHERLHDAHRSKQTKAHHLKPWEQAMGEDSFYRKRAVAIGPDVERLIVILLSQGQGFIDTRKIWGILSLDKKYDRDAINRACRDAVELTSYSYRTVMGLLSLQGQTKPEDRKNRNQDQNKFVRPLSVYDEQLKLIQ